MNRKSFRQWCNEDSDNRGYLLDEWDYSKNVINPAEITAHTSKKAWWICPKGHSYDMAVSARTDAKRKQKCPYCRNLRIEKGINDFQSQHPELMGQWDFEANEREGIYPDRISQCADKTVNWICPKCGHKYKQNVENKVRQHHGCPNCAGLIHHSLVGQRFGKLLVISELEKTIKDGSSKRRMVLCECECGKKVEVTEKNLKSGNTKSCGCLSKHKHIYEGRSFCVYMHKCKLNNKIYIGKTMQDPETRWRKGKGYSGYKKTPLWDDIKSFGWDSFEHVILDRGLSREAAQDREKYYIKLYDMVLCQDLDQVKMSSSPQLKCLFKPA